MPLRCSVADRLEVVFPLARPPLDGHGGQSCRQQPQQSQQQGSDSSGERCAVAVALPPLLCRPSLPCFPASTWCCTQPTVPALVAEAPAVAHRARHTAPPRPSQLITAGRVKGLLRDDADVGSISTEACFAVAKAAEVLLEAIARRGATHAAAAGRSALLEYSDVAAAVAEWEPLSFLADTVPQTVKAAALLDRMKPGSGGVQTAAAAAAAGAGAAS